MNGFLIRSSRELVGQKEKFASHESKVTVVENWQYASCISCLYILIGKQIFKDARWRDYIRVSLIYESNRRP